MEQDLFQANGLDGLAASLHLYIVSASDLYSSFIRHIIPLGFSCRGYMPEFDDMNEQVKSIKKCLIATVVFSALLIVLCFLFDFMFGLIFSPSTIPPFNHYGILACHPSYRSYRMDTPPVPLRVVGLFFKFLIYLGYIISAGIAFSESQKVTKFGKKVLNLSDCLDSITHEIITDLYNLLTNGIFYAIFIVFYVGVAVEPNLTYLVRLIIQKLFFDPV